MLCVKTSVVGTPSESGVSLLCPISLDTVLISLKGNQTDEALRALSTGMELEIDTEQFCTKFLVLFVKNQSLKVMKITLSAVILCPAMCTSDVMNRAGRCGKSIQHLVSQPFSALHWGAQIQSRKELLFV